MCALAQDRRMGGYLNIEYLGFLRNTHQKSMQNNSRSASPRLCAGLVALDYKR